MKSLPKTLSVLAIGSLIFLSGCIKMNVLQTVSEDGRSHIEVSYDASEFVEYMAGMEEEGGETFDMSDDAMQAACDDFYANTTWENPDCTVGDWVYTMSGDIQLESPWLDTSGGEFTYDLKHLYEILSSVGDAQDQDFSEQSLVEQKEMVELTGMEFTYTLTMPGKILSADVGTIQEDGKTVVINLFDMAGMEQVHVVAEGNGGLSTVMMAVIGGVVVLLVIGGVVVMKKKKGGMAKA